METVTSLLGWSTIINTGLLIFSTIMMVSMRGFIRKVHGKLLRISEGELDSEYFRFLANYKLLIIFFNLVPYIALKLIEK